MFCAPVYCFDNLTDFKTTEHRSFVIFTRTMKIGNRSNHFDIQEVGLYVPRKYISLIFNSKTFIPKKIPAVITQSRSTAACIRSIMGQAVYITGLFNLLTRQHYVL
jgi:hypothetical protein